MKKIILLLVSLGLIAGAGIYYMQQKDSRLSVENVLPEGALLYIHIHDVDENFQKLSEIPIWQTVKDIKYDILLENSDVNDQQLVLVDLVINQIADVMNNPVSKKLFGNEVALAIYSPEIDLAESIRQMQFLSAEFVEKLLSGIVMITRVKKDVQFAEFVSRFFSQFGADVSQSQTDYQGQVIRSVTVNQLGMTFGIVRLNDLLVIGVSEKAARASIDVFNGEQPSLMFDPLYEQAKLKALNPAHIVGYLNFEPVIQLVSEQGADILDLSGINSEEQKNKKQWDQGIAQMTAIKTMGVSTQIDPMLRVDGHMVFDPLQLDSEFAPFYTCPSQDNTTINFVPKDVLVYQWSNCFKLGYYWNQVKKEMERNNTPATQIDQLEEKIGMSITDELLPIFGEQFGGYLQDIQVGGFFPIPKLLLFIEIKNKANAEKLLNKLYEQPVTMIQQEDHNGVSVNYLALPMGQDIQPGYAFLNDFLLFSTSRQMIKDSIDASKNDMLSLSASPDFKEIDYGLTEKNRAVMYVKINAIVEKVKGVLDWSNQWMAAQDLKAQAFKAGSSKPLDEAKSNVAKMENEIQTLRDQVVILEDDIWNMESKGEDVTAKQDALNALSQALDIKKEEIAVEKDRMEGLAYVVEEFDKGAPKPEQRQMILDEVIHPLLEGLKSVKTFGARSSVDENIFRSSMILNVGP